MPPDMYVLRNPRFFTVLLLPFTSVATASPNLRVPQTFGRQYHCPRAPSGPVTESKVRWWGSGVKTELIVHARPRVPSHPRSIRPLMASRQIQKIYVPSSVSERLARYL